MSDEYQAYAAQQYAQQYAQLQQEQQEQATAQQAAAYAAALEPVWEQQMQEVAQAGTDLSEYKNQQLPLARIKKIMKSDEDVRMISAEAPVLFAKACELFILDITMRGWVHAEEARRRTLQRSDIAAAISKTEVLDFLADVVPVTEEGKAPDGAGDSGAAAADPTAAAAAAGAAYGYASPSAYQQP